MLVPHGELARHAHCERCGRNSPVVDGTPDAAATALEQLGWTKLAEEHWRCPVCCSRVSGEYRITER